jgi:hypothetical protein
MEIEAYTHKGGELDNPPDNLLEAQSTGNKFQKVREELGKSFHRGWPGWFGQLAFPFLFFFFFFFFFFFLFCFVF